MNNRDLGCEEFSKSESKRKRARDSKRRKSKTARFTENREIRAEQQEYIEEQPKTHRQQIQLSKTLAKSVAPMFEIRESKIKDAGRGVFVSSNQNIAPKGTKIPFVGKVKSSPPSKSVQSQYTIKLTQNQYLWGATEPDITKPLANWVNRALKSNISKEKMQEMTRTQNLRPRQDMRKANCHLTISGEEAYLVLTKDLPIGTELLTRYGSSFRI